MGQDGLSREPAVAGRFYPGEATALSREVEQFLDAGRPEGTPRAAYGVMAPHAGYVFSGPVAGRTFAAVQVPERVIVLGPNHTGRGRRIAVAMTDSFHLPGTDVPVDRELAQVILDCADGAEADLEAHRFEHSIEVELPFLLARQPALRVVAICLGGLSEEQAIALGESLHHAVRTIGDDVLVVASSDMSHYLPDERAREVDKVALTSLLSFDPSALYRTVVDEDISMCGFIPATVMLSYARAAGGTGAELLGYATSGDAFGDRDRVVGYAGVIVPK